MPKLSISPPFSNMREVGERYPESRLLGTLSINGTQHHIDAYEVKMVERFMKVADSTYDHDLSHFYRAAETSQQFFTTTIGDRRYVIFIYPHS